MIGCPDLRFGFVRRGTATTSRIGYTDTFTALDYSFRLNGTSTASVTLPSTGCFIDDVFPGEHELVVVRGEETVWIGTLRTMEDENGSVVCTADDLSWWLTVRRLTMSFDSTTTAVDSAQLAKSLITNALAGDNSMRLTVNVAYPGPQVKRDIRAKSFASNAIQELAQSSVDWTVQRRIMTIWGESAPRKPVGRITNADCETPPKVGRSLETRASRWWAIGASAALQDGTYSELEQMVESATLRSSIGLIEREVREPEITDATSLRTIGNSNLTRSVSGGPKSATCRLRATAGIDFSGVTPGTVYTVDLRGDSLSTQGNLRVIGWKESISRGSRLMELDLGTEAA